jgi:hypothetical protein
MKGLLQSIVSQYFIMMGDIQWRALIAVRIVVSSASLMTLLTWTICNATVLQL